uniref:Secreted protein n=1 Tax=Haptolina brevifila TaxID=156173 RepID=A0A7S2BAV8_9EUKA|mmetsp:Transcript_11173/g.22576  ORF Transcript_11173/g.22576 Transcript_11173/m.22576 type:complete len:102 (+) Transcript_11173:29-334(+)|eukprot:CAMPEP_0174729796 /NCGR_PEP_ID=MMETSP1094-20130205/54362_1 /TAXON_ID=156173 /ORGANISM="Chrysochromulina brevifilum, Strain UTEX LB 985" /LENGTH=101 /DNA_ID=CAMNT_0015931957 /DNA_START=26 /DNA_END=331 /DNA_ORIENTATION=-
MVVASIHALLVAASLSLGPPPSGIPPMARAKTAALVGPTVHIDIETWRRLRFSGLNADLNEEHQHAAAARVQTPATSTVREYRVVSEQEETDVLNVNKLRS